MPVVGAETLASTWQVSLIGRPHHVDGGERGVMEVGGS
jgi:hypothetical protein